MEQWMKEIDPATLPCPYNELAPVIGLEAAMILAEKYQGTSVYFNKLDSTLKEIRNEKIRKEFRGYNQKALARQFNLSEAWIRKILSESEEQPKYKQGTLFSEEVLKSTFKSTFAK